MLKRGLRRTFSLLGYEIVRWPKRSLASWRAAYIAELGIDVVLDVGANRGQYAQELRSNGFLGRVISFEPLPTAHSRLVELARGDNRWSVYDRLALSDREATRTLYESHNSVSSSLLPMMSTLIRSLPSTRAIARHEVCTQRLDAIGPQLIPPRSRCLLKVDTQGSELEVLQGATGILESVEALELELSFRELYEGQPLIFDLVRYAEQRGYRLRAVFPEFVNPETSELLQVNGFLQKVR